MRLMQRPAWLVAAALLVAGCGGGSGSERLIYKSAPPTDLTVSGPPEALKLSWTAAPHALRYHVYWSSDPEQWIANYAAYPDAGLETTEDTSVELNLATVTKHLYFQITGEIDLEGDPAFAVALLGYRIDGDDVEDHVQGLRWNRCPEGMTYDVGSESCTGTALQESDAHTAYGTTPAAAGSRPPTWTEWQSLMDCGRNTEARFDAAHDTACTDLSPQLLIGHDGLLLFAYDDADRCAADRILAVSLPDSHACLLPGTSVHVTLVEPL